MLESVDKNGMHKGDEGEDLNEILKRVFANIEGSAVGTDSEDDLKGLFADFDPNSPKLGNTVIERNKKLVALITKIASLDFGGAFKDNRIDAFGDAYEYLMTMYASNAGKSGGEFFMLQEVGELLARINMFLHDINFDKFGIAREDTLKEAVHEDDAPFDAIVSNPPYSIKWEGKTNPLNISDERFEPAGVLAPPSKADLAFTMHMPYYLSTDGTAAIVEFPGVLYRGGAEAKIREYMVKRRPQATSFSWTQAQNSNAATRRTNSCRATSSASLPASRSCARQSTPSSPIWKEVRRKCKKPISFVHRRLSI